MKVQIGRKGSPELVFTRFLIPGRAVARRIVDDEGLIIHYDVEVTVRGETEVYKVDPSSLDPERYQETCKLLMLACEHLLWEYDERSDLYVR